MGQVVQVNGDYRIKTSEGGTIFLDTGSNLGKVSISGTVEIAGQTLTLGSEQLNIRDNILIINFGEPTNQVSLNFSGIDVDRGSSPSASFLFDESTDTWQLALGSAPGPFFYDKSFIRLKGLTTDPSEDGGDLTLSPSGPLGKIKVGNIVGYEDRVKETTDGNVIPNKAYVDRAIFEGQALTANRISALDTIIIATDRDAPGSLDQFEQITSYTTFGQSAISLLVDGLLSAQFYKDKIGFFDLELSGLKITSRDVNQNIAITTKGTGKLETNYAMQFDQLSSNPVSGSSDTVLYGKAPGIGGSGLFAANSISAGELTTSNRALLLSMIF